MFVRKFKLCQYNYFIKYPVMIINATNPQCITSENHFRSGYKKAAEAIIDTGIAANIQ